MPGKKPRLLCLDDQPDNLRVRQLFLEQFGCTTVAVSDAQSCLHLATHEQFDLILLDYHLDLAEKITGEDVARDLRICLPDTPLIMLTGDPMIPASAKQSVDAVLIKGTSSPVDLLNVLRQFLPDCDIKPSRAPLPSDLFAKST